MAGQERKFAKKPMRLPPSPFLSPAIRAGDAATSILQKVFASRGFGSHQILTNWRAIVGDELAMFTAPEKLSWTPTPGSHPTEEGQTAVLHLRVDGPMAIEVQHMAGQIIERVNGYLGGQIIQSLRILQAPLPRTKPVRPQQREVEANRAAPEDHDQLDAALNSLKAAITGD